MEKVFLQMIDFNVNVSRQEYLKYVAQLDSVFRKEEEDIRQLIQEHESSKLSDEKKKQTQEKQTKATAITDVAAGAGGSNREQVAAGSSKDMTDQQIDMQQQELLTFVRVDLNVQNGQR